MSSAASGYPPSTHPGALHHRQWRVGVGWLVGVLLIACPGAVGIRAQTPAISKASATHGLASYVKFVDVNDYPDEFNNNVIDFVEYWSRSAAAPAGSAANHEEAAR